MLKQQFVGKEFIDLSTPHFQILKFHPDGNVDFEDGDQAEAEEVVAQWFIGSVWQLYDNGTFTVSPPADATGREVFGELQGSYKLGTYGPNTPEIELGQSVSGYEGVRLHIGGLLEPLGGGGFNSPYARFSFELSYPLPDGRVARINTGITMLGLEKPETPVEVALAPPTPVQATPSSSSVDKEVGDKFNIVSMKEPGTTDDNEAALIEEWFVGGSVVFFKDGTQLITLAPDAPGGTSFGQIIIDMHTLSPGAGRFGFTIEQSAEGVAGAQLSLAGEVDVVTLEIKFDGTMIVPDGSGELRKATLAKTILAIQR
jgi:hypothetical protein